MAETNEELLDRMATAEGAEWFKLRAAVLARMCAPGEVVVPVVPTDQRLLDGYNALNYPAPPVVGPLHQRTRDRWAAVYEAMTARPNNGGNDDAAA